MSNRDRFDGVAMRDVPASELAEYAQSLPARPLSPGSKRLYQSFRVAIHSACRLWFRIEVVGGENIPASGPFLLSAVHRSNLDFALVSNATKREMRYMGKSSVWKVHWTISTFFNALGGFPVERGGVDRDSLRIAEEVLGHGEPLVIFPEGARQSGPLVCEMFDGPAFIASRTGAPIVPLGIGGSARAMPIGKTFIRPRKIVLVVGEPLQAPERNAKGRVPRRAVSDLTTQLSERIQELFDEAQVRAGAA